VDISVIICAKNSEKTIEECLESVKGNNPLEIIVVDGMSKDNTVEIAQKYTEKFYSDQGRGLAYARQLGAEKATGEYIAYVDSDVILPEGCLAKMLEEMKERGYTAIHAQILSLKNRGYWEWAEDQHFRIAFNKEGERQAIGTIAAIYERDKVLTYKFDPSFTGAAEDGDLCYRLRRSGFKLGVSSAFAYHQHRASAKSFIKQRISYGKGNALYFWKNKSPLALFGASLLIPFGVYVCIRKRSLKMLPYYFVWSFFRNTSMSKELVSLTFKRLISRGE
jgi:glycosyltransferase involved in cell wall biosynthesis